MIRGFLGLMFMRFQTSAVVRSALVTPLKSNVVIRGRVHSTYCLWGRLGLGACPPTRIPFPSTCCCSFPTLQGMEGPEYGVGKTGFILTDSKKCLEISFLRFTCGRRMVLDFLSPLLLSLRGAQLNPSSGTGYLPIPLLFLYGVTMECQAPEPREDS